MTPPTHAASSMCFAPAPEVLDPPPAASGGDVQGRHGRPPEAKESPARSSRRILIRDEPKISLWAHGDTLQVAGHIVGAPGLGQGRREHVLRHHLHHALSYSVAEEGGRWGWRRRWRRRRWR